MSQSNESENRPALDVTHGQAQSPEEFTQYLRSFRPRAGQLAVDEICSELPPQIVPAPSTFLFQPAASQAFNTQSSYLRMGVAWACGMVMGAAITSLLTTQFQKQTATQNGLAVSSTETDSEENRESSDRSSEATAVVNTTRTLPEPVGQERHYSIRLPEDNFFENRPLAASLLWLRTEIESDSDRSFDVPYSEPKSSDRTDENTLEINFEPSNPKTQRHILMQKLLEESI